MPGTDSREELGMLLTLSCCSLPAPHFLADSYSSAEIPWDLGSLCCFHLNMRRAVCRAQATRQQFGLSLTLSKPNYQGFRVTASSCQVGSIYPQAGGTRPTAALRLLPVPGVPHRLTLAVREGDGGLAYLTALDN